MTIRITGDGPKITATGSGSTVLVEISTGQHDPGSFSGVHNDLTGRSTSGAHVGTAVSIDPTGFNGNLDGTITNAQLLAAAVDDLVAGGGGGGGAVDSVDGRTGVVTLSDLYDAAGAAQAVADTLGDAATKDVGTTAGTVAAGDDARLSDARTPTSHASSHASAGSDPVTLAQSQVTNLTTDLAGKAASSHSHAGTDITSGTVGTARLGSGSASSATFLRGDQTWATPAGIADPGGSNDDFLQRKSGAWANRTVAQVKTDLGVITVSQPGFPTLSGGIGSDHWAMPPGLSASSIASTIGLSTGTAWITPFRAETTITITAAAVRATATAAGSVTRAAIVKLDSTLQPTALTYEFATFDTSSSGVKSQTGLSVTLTPGLYATYVKTEVATPTLVYYAGLIQTHMGVSASLSSGGLLSNSMSVAITAGAYANPPAGGSSYSTVGYSCLFLRWTV